MRIEQAHSKDRNGGVMAVVEKNQQGKWQKLLERGNIEMACMRENCTRFLQSMTAGPPLNCEPRLGKLGYLAVSEDARRVLRGEYNLLPETDPYTLKLSFF